MNREKKYEISWKPILKIWNMEKLYESWENNIDCGKNMKSQENLLSTIGNMGKLYEPWKILNPKAMKS